MLPTKYVYLTSNRIKKFNVITEKILFKYFQEPKGMQEISHAKAKIINYDIVNCYLIINANLYIFTYMYIFSYLYIFTSMQGGYN